MASFAFLDGLDSDLRNVLLAQIRNLWTHASTALEGNTLTLGDTAFLLEEGLTVKGKPLKDHQSVVGHAKAIELVYRMIGSKGAITEQDLFLLHQAIQDEVIIDIYSPVGAWKVERNWTNIVKDGRQIAHEYASPEDVPVLMKAWLRLLNEESQKEHDEVSANLTYAKLHLSFVSVHPFFDGNGRIARIVSNIPILKSGMPPIVIQKESRKEYIQLLSDYQLLFGATGEQRTMSPEDLIVENKEFERFVKFCFSQWAPTMELVRDAHSQQAKRRLSTSL